MYDQLALIKTLKTSLGFINIDGFTIDRVNTSLKYFAN